MESIPSPRGVVLAKIECRVIIGGRVPPALAILLSQFVLSNRQDGPVIADAGSLIDLHKKRFLSSTHSNVGTAYRAEPALEVIHSVS